MKKIIYWTPRILSIIFIAFLVLFSLDIFDESLGFWGTVVGLFMHNIPALVLLVVLVISWKREWLGGIVFILAGILYIFLTLKRVPNISIAFSWSLIIAGPAFLVGLLFLNDWFRKKYQ